MRIKLIIILFILHLVSTIKLKIAPISADDGEFRQANVPPLVSTIFDVPAYGKNDLFKWVDYIEGNLQMQNKKKIETEQRRKINHRMLFNTYIPK